MINAVSLDLAQSAMGAEPGGWISQADHDRAVSAARAEGFKAGATAERDRFKKVTDCEHFTGREASAMHMLTTTDMSAEAITGVLAGLPVTATRTSAVPPSSRSRDAQGGLVLFDVARNCAAASQQDDDER